MFGIEARIPIELVVGRPKFELQPAAYALSHCKILEKAYENPRENLKTSQKCMKDRYDLGASERIFHLGDSVPIRLKNLSFKPASKLQAPWSELFQVVEVRGPVISIKKLNSETIIRVHSDRLVNVTPRLRPEPRFPNELILFPDDSNNPIDENGRPDENSGDRQVKIGDRHVDNGRRHVNLSDRHTSESDGAVSEKEENLDDLINPIDLNNSNADNSEIINRGEGKRPIKSTKKSDYVYNLMFINYRKME